MDAHHHRHHQAQFAGTVRRVNHHRQVALVVQVGDRRQWQRKPRVVFVRADSSFAEHHVGIAPVENILGGQEKLFDCGAACRASGARLARIADGLEQLIVLHIAGANLEHVGVFGDDRDMLGSHDFGDHGQSGLGARSPTSSAQVPCVLGSYKGWCAACRLRRADRWPQRLELFRERHDLLFTFDRARTGNHGNPRAADLQSALNDSSLTLDF